MKERYTSEEIWYEDAGIASTGSEQTRMLLARALSKVPKDVADRVLEECFIIMPMLDEEIGMFMPKEILQDKCLITLTEKLLEKDEEYIVHTVLHEVAHFYLGHKSPVFADLSGEQTKSQEKEADRLADKWLREFEIDQNKNTAQK